MKNLVKKKKRLFDGAERDFHLFNSLLDIADYGQIPLDNRRVQYLWELGEEQADEIIGLIPGTKKHVAFPGDTPAYKQDNLTLYAQQVQGPGSRPSVVVVIAAGEAQPARFIINLCGVLV